MLKVGKRNRVRERKIGGRWIRVEGKQKKVWSEEKRSERRKITDSAGMFSALADPALPDAHC